jgi:hypothetical protein
MTTTQGTQPAAIFTRRAAFYPRVSRSGKRTLAVLERHTLAVQLANAEACCRGASSSSSTIAIATSTSPGARAPIERPGLSALFADLEAGR